MQDGFVMKLAVYMRTDAETESLPGKATLFGFSAMKAGQERFPISARVPYTILRAIAIS